MFNLLSLLLLVVALLAFGLGHCRVGRFSCPVYPWPIPHLEPCFCGALFIALVQVRGVGLMIAVEFVDKAGVASAVSQAALKHELMLLTAVRSPACIFVPAGAVLIDVLLQGAFEVMRFIPALNVTEKEIDQGLERFGKALADVFPRK